MLVAVLSRTPKAADVRYEIIQVYVDFRRRKTTPEALPAPEQPSPQSPAWGEQATGMLAVAVFQLDLMKFVLRAEGRETMRRMWPSMKCLPPIPGVTGAVAPVHDGALCLAHILASIDPNGERCGRVIERALSAEDFGSGIKLAIAGLKVSEDGDGLVVANSHESLSRLFAGTPWAANRWPNALLKLPGASRKNVRFAGFPSRGTFVPAQVVLEAAIAADPR